ncbi:hypothetical protein RRG08_047988 [Elysia crispata]|uniref:Potassium channel domain-containing protein n=1 Tax=Elysia crispata TaxID=231223 RepID=A0AAE1DMY5_9GAST|nr:hypothetical protein RRG08_047988 [Elysia crispata]
MASLPKLRPFSPSVRNDFNNPRRFPDNQGRQPPSSDPNNQYRDPLLSSYLGKGARLASIDSYHDYPEDNDSLSDHTLLPSDTRCPLIAEDDGEFLSDTPPAILEVAPSIQCPYPSNLASTPPRAATEEDAPNIEEMEKPGAPKPSENFVHSEVIASPSRSLDKFPSSPSHGFPYDDRANTMSTVCSSQQPPAYSVADTSKISSRDPETMSPFHRFRSAAVGVHAAVRLTRMQRLTKKAKWASKKFIVFTLSKVGLTCVVAAYVIFGAFLFAHLESHELEPQTTPSTVGAVGTPLDVRLSPNLPEYSDMEEDVLKLREKYLANMWNTTIELNVFYFDLWHENIKADLEGFERGLLEIVKKHSLPGLTTAPSVTTAATINTSDTTDAPAAAAAQTQQDQSWSYATALLFCVAVVTTIGYGDIVPTTPEGKVACMFYALIGIPMMLLCLANIGHFLAACFRFLWQHARLLCLVKEKKNDTTTA